MNTDILQFQSDYQEACHENILKRLTEECRQPYPGWPMPLPPRKMTSAFRIWLSSAMSSISEAPNAVPCSERRW